MKTMLKNARDTVLSWRFLLNLALILIATSWLSLMSRTVTMRDGDGNIIQEMTLTPRLYQSWWAVITMTPAMKSHARAVALHFAVCFSISFIVWHITVNTGKRDADVETRPEADKEAPSDDG